MAANLKNRMNGNNGCKNFFNNINTSRKNTFQRWKSTILNQYHRIFQRLTNKKTKNVDERPRNSKDFEDILLEPPTKANIERRFFCPEDCDKNLIFLEVQQGRSWACPCESPFIYELIGPISEPKKYRLLFLPRRSRKICLRQRIINRKRFLSRRTLF